MWIMLNDAFFSIVAKDCGPDELMVRARRPGDIEKVFPELAGKVKAFTASDYHYRAAVKRERVALAISKAIFGIDYSNFKNSVQDDGLHNAYHRVWHAMADLQPQPPYSGRRRNLTPVEDAYLFATGHMPSDFDDGMGGSYRPGAVIDVDRPKKAKKRPAKKNTRGR